MKFTYPLVCYIRGGLGDVWPAVCAIKAYQEKHHIDKFSTLVITDSVYYFRDNYPKELEKYSIDMIRKITNNILMVPPEINNQFQLTVDDVTEEFSQENVDKNLNEFMFWRPQMLKEYVQQYLNHPKVIFIDAFFTECILIWKDNKYERIENDRKVFEFKPIKLEKQIIDYILLQPHILIHIRKKIEGDSHTFDEHYYNNIIEFCNLNNILPIVMGIDEYKLKGKFVNLIGFSPYSLEGMSYLIDKCDIMLGNDSGFSSIKLYQQQKDKLLIMEHPRWERSPWYFRAIKDESNCVLLDARNKNIDEIKQRIKDYNDKNN